LADFFNTKIENINEDSRINLIPKIMSYITLLYLEYGFLHLDLHSGNILINNETFEPKLIDFGYFVFLDDPFFFNMLNNHLEKEKKINRIEEEIIYNYDFFIERRQNFKKNILNKNILNKNDLKKIMNDIFNLISIFEIIFFDSKQNQISWYGKFIKKLSLNKDTIIETINKYLLNFYKNRNTTNKLKNKIETKMKEKKIYNLLSN
jgi:hypothetical protein